MFWELTQHGLAQLTTTSWMTFRVWRNCFQNHLNDLRWTSRLCNGTIQSWRTDVSFSPHKTCSRSYGPVCCWSTFQVSSNLETWNSRSRQAHFIRWWYANYIGNPAGLELRWQNILARYIKYIMTGVNYLNKGSGRSATCKGYALNVARLFTSRGYPRPVILFWSKMLD